MDGAVSVFLARGKNREEQRPCAYVGSSIWSWSRAAVRATEARGRCVWLQPTGGGWGLSLPSLVAIYKWEIMSTSDK